MTTESEATASPLTARTKALGDGDDDDDKDGGGGGDKAAGTGAAAAAAVDAAAAAHRERLAEVDAQVRASPIELSADCSRSPDKTIS